MAVVGKLTALLTCNAAAFHTGMTGAMGTTAKLGATCASTSGAVAGMGAAMGTAAVATTGLTAKLWAMTAAAAASLKAMLPLAAVMATIYAGVKAGSVAEEFNQAMSSSIAIMGDIGDARSRMGQIAKQVAYDTKFSNKEAAESYYFLASAGLKAEQQMAALPFTAKFAQAGMFDLSRATELLTGSQSALGLASDNAAQHLENMTRVGDVLVKANTLAMASVEQFAEALGNKAAAAGRLANQSLEEVVSVLAVFAQNNRKGSEAGTAYNIVMREMKNKSLENAAAFKKFGVTVWDASGKVRYLADIIEDLEGLMATMTPKQFTEAMAQMGFQAKSRIFIQMLLGTSGAMKGFKEELQDAGGFTEEVASKQLPAFTDAMKKLANVLGRIAILTVGPVLELIGRALLLILWPIEKVVTGLELLAAEFGRIFGGAMTKMATRFKAAWQYLFGSSENINKTNAALQDTAGAMEDVEEEISEASKALDSWMEKTKFAIRYYGMEADALELVRLAYKGAFKTQAEFDKATRLMWDLRKLKEIEKAGKAQAKAIEDRARSLEQAGKSVFESTRTPMEKYQATLDDLNRLLKAGAIDWDTYGRAVRKAGDEMRSASGASTDVASPAALQRGTQAALTAAISMKARDNPVVKKLDQQIQLQQQDADRQQQIVINLDRLVAGDDVVIEM